MGKMYTLQPNESINDHVKESMSIINHIVELSIGCMRDLANPHEGTFVDMTYDKFMRSLEHIRESIQMLDELCDELEDELEDDKDVTSFDISSLYPTALIAERFPMEKEHSRLKAQYGELQKECSNWKDLCYTLDKHCKDLEHQLKEEHERYMKLREAKEQSPAYWKAKFERMQKKSNQLEEQLTAIKGERDLAKKLARRLLDEKKAIKTDLTRAELECKNLRVVLDKKYAEIEELTKENFALEKRIPDYFKAPNNPQNFCGNCKYFITHPNDVATCNNKHADLFIVDPDDASCPFFKSNQVDRDKPDHPCCEACDHDDCDDCALCPF